MRFCIDPGHGGKDPGALGRHHNEEDYNLLVGLELKKILIAKGHQVVMTRETDVFVELKQRYTIANNFKADRFCSIHLNSAESPKANGSEVLYKRITAKYLAAKMAKDLSGLLKVTNRGAVYRDDLAVLNGTRMDAILAEIAFISNLTEEEKVAHAIRQIANLLAWNLITFK